MNKIEKMIKELCPNGVEWKKLGEIARFKYGYTGTALDTGSVRYIRITDITTRGVLDSKDAKYIDLTEDNKNYILKKGDILMARTGATFGKTLYFSECHPCIYASFLIKIELSSCVNPRYYWHFSQSNIYWNQAYKFVGGGAQPQFNTNAVSQVSIPLPPLPIQTEIVRILDKFVEQQEQLERLIELRKKQYEYYREEMLKPKEGEKWETVTIGELGTITRGRRFVRDDVRDSGMPCIHYGDMYTYYGITAKTTKTFLDRDFPKKMQYAKKGDVVVVGAGENDLDIGVGTVWEGEEPAAVHDACYILEHKQNPKYIAYFLRTNNYHQQLRKYVSDGKICSISSKGLGSCFIPIPSLTKQQEIVDFLDNFEDNISKMKSALELSKKRYEYYRDKMLRF
ncbi:MAG: restriction endonuclease subunit S [Paludibacteraceae bacterium]|nr:restriction endonuclease subunit S [Paludibacteraceae bacterium]